MTWKLSWTAFARKSHQISSDNCFCQSKSTNLYILTLSLLSHVFFRHELNHRGRRNCMVWFCSLNRGIVISTIVKRGKEMLCRALNWLPSERSEKLVSKFSSKTRTSLNQQWADPQRKVFVFLHSSRRATRDESSSLQLWLPLLCTFSNTSTAFFKLALGLKEKVGMAKREKFLCFVIVDVWWPQGSPAGPPDQSSLCLDHFQVFVEISNWST